MAAVSIDLDEVVPAGGGGLGSGSLRVLGGLVVPVTGVVVVGVPWVGGVHRALVDHRELVLPGYVLVAGAVGILVMQ